MDIVKGTIQDAQKAVAAQIDHIDNSSKDVIDHVFSQVRSLLDDYKVTVIFEKVK